MTETVTIVVPAGYASGEDFAKDCGFEIVKQAPLPWDAGSNRRYAPVEDRAAEIYATFVYEGLGQKPGWQPHGNSVKQDEARFEARRQLRIAGHTPGETSNGER